MFFTLNFTSRERYRKAVSYLMSRSDKYYLIGRGKDYCADFKNAHTGHGWYVYFSKRLYKK